MTSKLYLKNGLIVNEGRIFKGGILIDGEIISDIIDYSVGHSVSGDVMTVDLEGLHVFPGVIDSHVHFREPGMTHKGDIASESKAAIAGGVTSVIEMPNTIPQTTSLKSLDDKIKIAENNSLVNYAFYLGATNSNIDQLISADPSYIPGIKVFMGASTGDMLVDDQDSLIEIFNKVKSLIAVHCEDEKIIQRNLLQAKKEYGDDIPFGLHPQIRSSEACYKSSLKAVSLALKYQARLHLLHISTEREIDLFYDLPCDSAKQVTAEVCVHHLLFTDDDYNKKQSFIKWNPAIKSHADRVALRNSLNTNKIDIVSTDHAPHSVEEKKQPYLSCPSGAPMIQHSLEAMLDLYHEKVISLETIAEKMCHNPARCFNIKDRGFIRKGFIADLAIVNLNMDWKIEKENILYKCKWSPLEGRVLKSKVIHTFVNGRHVYNSGVIDGSKSGKLLSFSK